MRALESGEGTFDGPVRLERLYRDEPVQGHGAGRGFSCFDERIQKILRRRLTGDNRRALTEMYCFAVGSGQGASFAGPARSSGSKRGGSPQVHHQVGYSIGVKERARLGVGYLPLGGDRYDNDFGMTYNKPLNRQPRRQLRAGADAKIREGWRASGHRPQSTASTEHELDADDWRPSSVVKVAAGAGGLGRRDLELVRVSSDKHPPSSSTSWGR